MPRSTRRASQPRNTKNPAGQAPSPSMWNRRAGGSARFALRLAFMVGLSAVACVALAHTASADEKDPGTLRDTKAADKAHRPTMLSGVTKTVGSTVRQTTSKTSVPTTNTTSDSRSDQGARVKPRRALDEVRTESTTARHSSSTDYTPRHAASTDNDSTSTHTNTGVAKHQDHQGNSKRNNIIRTVAENPASSQDNSEKADTGISEISSVSDNAKPKTEKSQTNSASHKSDNAKNITKNLESSDSQESNSTLVSAENSSQDLTASDSGSQNSADEDASNDPDSDSLGTNGRNDLADALDEITQVVIGSSSTSDHTTSTSDHTADHSKNDSDSSSSHGHGESAAVDQSQTSGEAANGGASEDTGTRSTDVDADGNDTDGNDLSTPAKTSSAAKAGDADSLRPIQDRHTADQNGASETHTDRASGEIKDTGGAADALLGIGQLLGMTGDYSVSGAESRSAEAHDAATTQSSENLAVGSDAVAGENASGRSTSNADGPTTAVAPAADTLLAPLTRSILGGPADGTTDLRKIDGSVTAGGRSTASPDTRLETQSATIHDDASVASADHTDADAEVHGNRPVLLSVPLGTEDATDPTAGMSPAGSADDQDSSKVRGLDDQADHSAIGDLLERTTGALLGRAAVAVLVDHAVEPLISHTVRPLVDQTVGPLVDETVPLVDQAVAPIVDMTVLPLVDETVTPLLDQTVTPLVDEVAQVAGPPVEAVTEPVVSVVRPVTQAIGDVTAPVITTVTDVTAPVVTTVTDVTDPVVTTVTDVTAPVISSVTEVAGPVITTVTAPVASATSTVTNIVQPLVSAVSTPLGSVTGTITSVTEQLTGAVVPTVIATTPLWSDWTAATPVMQGPQAQLQTVDPLTSVSAGSPALTVTAMGPVQAITSTEPTSFQLATGTVRLGSGTADLHRIAGLSGTPTASPLRSSADSLGSSTADSSHRIGQPNLKAGGVDVIAPTGGGSGSGGAGGANSSVGGSAATSNAGILADAFKLPTLNQLGTVHPESENLPTGPTFGPGSSPD